MKKAIIIATLIVVIFVGFGIYNVKNNRNKMMDVIGGNKLSDVDVFTAERIVNYHKKIFIYCGLNSEYVTEGMYNTKSKNLYLNCVNNRWVSVDSETFYVYIENGDVNIVEGEIMDFNEYKNNNECICFTGEEYVKFLNSYGCNL